MKIQGFQGYNNGLILCLKFYVFMWVQLKEAITLHCHYVCLGDTAIYSL